MKILLLGANGQVGFELTRVLSPLGEMVLATRSGKLPGGAVCEKVALTCSKELMLLLERIQPNLIVNAAAYTAVDQAEDEPELADQINHRALHVLGKWAEENNAAVVHYSTDYVFDGCANRPYRENDSPAPLGVYGHSKLAGEKVLQSFGADHLIFRTAWVYGARGKNFLRTILRLANEREQLRIVNDQYSAPTSSRLIAAASALVIARWLDASAQQRRLFQGVYHLVATGQCTWFEFTCSIVNSAFHTGILHKVPEILPISTIEFPTKAKRPVYSVLDTQKIQTIFRLYLPSWQDGLNQVIGEIAETHKLKELPC